jgi:hypothetical protein
MKLKILFLALFVGGLLASMAVAKPPPGKGNPGKGNGANAATTTGTSTSTTSTSGDRKVTLCHRTGSKTNPWVKIKVSAKSAAQHRRRGDVDPVGGKCPAAKTKPGSTTTTSTTTSTTATTNAATTSTTTTTSG